QVRCFDGQPADRRDLPSDCIRHGGIDCVELRGKNAHDDLPCSRDACVASSCPGRGDAGVAATGAQGRSSPAIRSICTSRSASICPCPALILHPPGLIESSSTIATCSIAGHCILSCGSAVLSV